MMKNIKLPGVFTSGLMEDINALKGDILHMYVRDKNSLC